MKKIIIALTMTLLFMGCNNNSAALQSTPAKLVVGQSLQGMQLKDQHGKIETISPKTTLLFFSFSKSVGHMCNEFLEKKPADFLEKHHTLYVADVSPAPTIIKKIFILPDLKDLPFKILLINDDTLSAAYSKGMNKESIVVVHLKDGTITKIENLDSKEALEKFFK
jgi:uncharacterized lipoprotein NlpE involved in copper resistance